MTVLLAAVIGASGVVLGAAIRAFGPELINRLRSGSHNGLAGTWTGEWSVDWPQQKVSKLTDTVSLTVSPKGVVAGKGALPRVGEYRVEGHDSRFCVTLVFCGVRHRESLAGTVLLRKDTNADHLVGVWNQLAEDGTLMGGSVELTRL